MARRHSSSEDFQLVGMDSDPTPGDPDLIQGVVQRYRDIGDAAEKALNVLKKDGAVSTGKGSAMEQLKAKIGDDLPDKLTKTMTSYHDAAQAYSEYMPRLREAQGAFDQAVDRAQAAAPQANQTPQQLSADPTDEERAKTRAAQDAIDAGQAEMSVARSLAEQAKTLRESAQRRCAEVLDRAAAEAIPERNVFQKIADFFKDFPFVQILLAALIAVVAVFFPAVGVLLGGVLFAFNQVVASQTGGIKAGDFVTGLLGIIPGGSLLKLGSRAAEAISPSIVAAVKNSSLISKTTGTITRISESLTNSKVVGGFLGHPVGKAVTGVVGGFLGNSAVEAAAKAANRDEITAAGVFAGAAAGAVAGAVFKGGVGAIGKARGNKPVEDGQSGRFGDTAEPSAGDSSASRFRTSWAASSRRAPPSEPRSALVSLRAATPTTWRQARWRTPPRSSPSVRLAEPASAAPSTVSSTRFLSKAAPDLMPCRQRQRQRLRQTCRCRRRPSAHAPRRRPHSIPPTSRMPTRPPYGPRRSRRKPPARSRTAAPTRPVRRPVRHPPRRPVRPELTPRAARAVAHPDLHP